MNWFTAVGAVLHILKNVPDLVDDVEDFWSKLTGKEEPPEDLAATVSQAISNAKQA